MELSERYAQFFMEKLIEKLQKGEGKEIFVCRKYNGKIHIEVQEPQGSNPCAER